MGNTYKDLIFTNHVLKRMKERGITQEQVWETYNSPDNQEASKNNAIERSKKVGDHKITIVYKHNDQNQVIVLSSWIDPPLAGTRDAKEKEWWNKYKKAGFWGKIWLTFIHQLTG